MGWGRLVGLAIAGAVSYDIVKKSGISKEIKKIIKNKRRLK